MRCTPKGRTLALFYVYLEIRDPKVEEFFKSVLKEGQPADEALRILIEDPCRARRIVAASKYEERVAGVFEEFISNIAAYIEYVVAKRIAEAVAAASETTKATTSGDGKSSKGGVAQCPGDYADRRKCLEAAMANAGGCMKFSEIEEVYGRRLNSKMLERWGFVRRGKGVWCIPEEVRPKRRAGKRA